MHIPAKPNPVAAILDIIRESLPLASARSFTCPVFWLASSQKKWKVARSISSRSCSSVPSGGAPAGSTKDRGARFPHPASVASGEASKPIPQVLMSSLRERERSPIICGSCLFRDLKCRFGAVTRVRTYPERDTRGLGRELVLIVPKSKGFGSEGEHHFFCFTGSKRNALETTQCF